MLTEFSNQLADIVAAAAPSVLQVVGHRRPASGVVYAEGVVVTTARVVGRENGLRVRQHDGHAHDAELAGWDPGTGLAVLRAPGLHAPPFAPSGAPVRVGHVAVALARSWSNAITASAGIVAVIGGPLRTGRRRAIEEVYRTTAPMHDGFAGGACVDTAGGLLGIATASAIRGLAVVIPASIAWKAAANVLEHGGSKRGYLGLAAQPVTVPEAQRGPTGRERGVLVVALSPDGPAARAGAMIGDVLIAIEGNPIESPEDLLDVLQGTAPGRDIAVQILRAGSAVELTVTVGERPAR